MKDLRPSIAGAIIGFGFLLLFYGIFYTNKPHAENSVKFQVIDTYQGCDVIRYTDQTQRWHYFFKCS
jgi:hypothetical protein